MSRLPISGTYPKDWPIIAERVKREAGYCCIRCNHPDDQASGHVLTVHHLDGAKDNCEWWNLLALCQRCHLRIQGRVNPHDHWFLEHSEWFKPYAAGFYAFKYLGLTISRQDAEDRLEELLALERRA